MHATTDQTFMDPLQGKKILLLVGGSIAAYKIPETIRLLRAAGATVRVVLGEAAARFVTPLALQALSGEPVRQDLFAASEEAAMDHIRLARWADILLFAPVSASGMARLAQGLADDLTGTIALASRAPRYLAPAMNGAMWDHPATRRNLARLQSDGCHILGPAAGSLACGEEGSGRMIAPGDIVAELRLAAGSHPWQGWEVLVTAGPTWEAWDPVRGISNRASGRQGYALAQSAAELGANVTLVSGPTCLPAPAGVVRVDTVSARDMLEACIGRLEQSPPVDLFIANAAVADHRPETASERKTPKDHIRTLSLAPNPDIVALLHAHRNRPRWIAAFAAETHGEEQRAAEKLYRKGADLAAVNDLRMGAMGGTDNAFTLFFGEERLPLGPAPKLDLARSMMHHLAGWLNRE